MALGKPTTKLFPAAAHSLISDSLVMTTKSLECDKPVACQNMECTTRVNECTSLLLPPRNDDLDSDDLSLLSEAVQERGRGELRILVAACCLTCFFFVVELVGGYYAHSLAVMSDAAHLLSDLAGLFISLIAVSLSRVPASEMMSFGYARAEVLGAFVSVIFIWGLTGVLVVAAIRRIFYPTPVNGRLMLLLGAVGLAVNICLGLVLGHGHRHVHLHSHCHDHDEENLAHDYDHDHVHHHHNNYHTHDHEGVEHRHAQDEEENEDSGNKWGLNWNRFTGADIESVNVRAAYLHVLGDALQSVGVILAAIVIMFVPKWTVVDPICTLLFAVIVVFTTKGLAHEVFEVLMEAAPRNVRLRSVCARLTSINGVVRVGDLHAWSLSLQRPALSAHIYSDGTVSDHHVLKQAQHILKEEFGVEHTTIQIMTCVRKDCCDGTAAKSGQALCLSTVNLQ